MRAWPSRGRSLGAVARHLPHPLHARGAAAADVAAFAALLGEAHVLTTPADTAPYRTDWLRQYSGCADGACVLRPGSTAEVSAVMRHCSARRLAVVPQGGNTGLVGGGVPVGREVVLSLGRLNAVEAFDEDAGVVVCGAGTVLQALDAFLAERGYMVPLDLGSKGSCMLGGNVATNAGGLRLLRYGSLKGSVMGLEVVLADGTMLDLMSTLRKDNVGFDLKQLFVGSEGALGIITRVALLAAPRPAAVNVALLGVASFDKCRYLLKLARLALGEVLSAAEFVDGPAMRITVDTLKIASPLASAHMFWFFVESAGSNQAHDASKMEAFLERALANGLADDGVLAESSAQGRRIFRLREEVSVALTQRGHVFKYDVSLRMNDMYALVEAMRARLAARGWPTEGPDRVAAVGYGHIGDGNLHLNVSTSGRAQEFLPRLAADIEPFVYEWVLSRGGSISAEHGVGQAKADWVGRAKPAAAVGLMRDLKKLLDAHNLLNPGKVLPLE